MDNKEFNQKLNEADQVVHSVEKEWCYKTLTPYGFKSLNLSGIGFVRSYDFQKDDLKITYTIGAQADYWVSSDGSCGYWRDLEIYLEKNFGAKHG